MEFWGPCGPWRAVILGYWDVEDLWRSAARGSVGWRRGFVGVVLVRFAEEMMWGSKKGHDRTRCVGCASASPFSVWEEGWWDSLARCLRAGWRLFASSCFVCGGISRLHWMLRKRCGEH